MSNIILFRDVSLYYTNSDLNNFTGCIQMYKHVPIHVQLYSSPQIIPIYGNFEFNLNSIIKSAVYYTIPVIN